MVSLQFSLPGVKSPGGRMEIAARREEIATVRDTPIRPLIKLGFLFVNHEALVAGLVGLLELLYPLPQNGR
jgi:hypothetical protein